MGNPARERRMVIDDGYRDPTPEQTAYDHSGVRTLSDGTIVSDDDFSGQYGEPIYGTPHRRPPDLQPDNYPVQLVIAGAISYYHITPAYLLVNF